MKSFKSIVIIVIASAVVTSVLLSLAGFHVTADNFVWSTLLQILANLGIYYMVINIVQNYKYNKALDAKFKELEEMNNRKPVEVRPVCGGLDESMSKVTKYLSLTGFILDTCMKDEFTQFTNISKFTTKYQGYDARTDWDTWMILYDGQPIAYSNGELK